MKSSSKSSSSSETKYENEDRRQVVDGGSQGFSTGTNVEVSGKNANVTNTSNLQLVDPGALDALKATATALEGSFKEFAAGITVSSMANAQANAQVSDRAIAAAVDSSKKSSDAAYASSTAALGFATDVLKMQDSYQQIVKDTQAGVATAYKSAASISTGQEAIVKTGLVIAGVVGLAAVSMAMKKG